MAGNACREAWLADPASADAEMNIGPDTVDLHELTDYEQDFVRAVQQHLDDFLKVHRLIMPIRRKHTHSA
ncbi:hypothetical protein ACQI4L_28545 [Mycolicibacterium litorale]|uniref:hypothetical protein n=1 Tax=Mycolicibacterium litorale TaxID=758802 RepID=UPI003CEE8115